MLHELLLTRAWWVYCPGSADIHAQLYHSFNLVESSVWWVFAALVLLRFMRFRKSPRELLYALAFVLFGLTDLRESYCLSSWLIWAKLVNLGLLLWLRATVMRRFYPHSRVY
jgi:hypothetical protein